MSTVIKPKLGVFDLTMVVVSLIIGLGIFRIPVEVANKAQTPTLFFMAWGLGAIISLCGALTFAEIGSRYPTAGGYYKIFSYCYHPVIAFMVNWISVISNAATSALVAIIGADYINPIILPDVERELGVKITTILSVLVLFGVNFIGIKMSSRVLNVLMFIKIGMLLLLISLVFIGHTPTPAMASYSSLSLSESGKAFLLCFVPVFFTCGGYHMMINFGSDIKEPHKNLPRSIFFGIAIAFTMYMLVNFSYYYVLGFEALKNSNALAADMVSIIFGSTGFKLVAVIMFFAVLAYVNSSIMANPRVYYAMAEDGVLPPILKQVNEKTQVQEWALTLYVTFIIITLFLLSSVQKILDYVMFFDSIGMSLAVGSVFVLRHRAKKNGEPPGIYKMFAYPLLPILFILVYMSVNVSVMINNPATAMIGSIMLMSGWPLYYVIRHIIKGKKPDQSGNQVQE
jgi:basic amino acid/polyamine antiporter, APA family